jgi:DNA (cytosine-5)-methyltransferase 1
MTPTFVDLFGGCGGLTLGLTRAGWKCLLAIDHWPDASATYRRNFPDHQCLNADIQHVSRRHFASLLPQRPTWVVGGPPCQGFSTVGKRVRDDPRNNLVREFRRVVSILEPEGFCLENVIGLRDMDFEGPVSDLFADLGYTVTSTVLRAADFGVPQLRRRIVFIGHRERGYFQGARARMTPNEYTSVWDAIGDLPELRPGEAKCAYDKEPFTDYQRDMRSESRTLQAHRASSHPAHLIKAISFIPDGGNRRSIPEQYQPRSGFHNSYSRLSSRAPAVAVTSNMGKPSATRCIHPFQDRGLTAREGARLQSFPDRFEFLGGLVSQRLQVANAVPPVLAEAIGRAIDDEERWSSIAEVGAQLAFAAA